MTLRARIMLLAVSTTAVALAIFVVPVGLTLHTTVRQETRSAAAREAQSVAGELSTGPFTTARVERIVSAATSRDDAFAVGVVLPDGARIGPDKAFAAASSRVTNPDDPDGDADRDSGANYAAAFTAVRGGTVTTADAHRAGAEARVVVFVPTTAVTHRLTGLMGILIASAITVMVLAAAAAEVLSRRVVRRLDAAASTADRLSEGDLQARVADAGPPEVQRVGTALNRLASRIEDLLVAERETVADLSHRLRTPLTTVRLDVEALAPSPAKSALEADLATLERTLTDVIRAARRPQREGARAKADAVAVAKARVAHWEPLAEDQNRSFTTRFGDTATPVACASDDLADAVDALIQNTFAHTDEGTAMRVTVADDGAMVVVEVADRGPGVPPEALVRGRSDRGSSGLGLDIAARCARASGGRIELHHEDGWAMVRLVVGRA